MPLYTWKSDTTGREVDVLRSFADYEVEPDTREMGVDKDGNPDTGPWTRLLGKGIKVTRGENWGHGKGNW